MSSSSQVTLSNFQHGPDQYPEQATPSTTMSRQNERAGHKRRERADSHMTIVDPSLSPYLRALAGPTYSFGPQTSGPALEHAETPHAASNVVLSVPLHSSSKTVSLSYSPLPRPFPGSSSGLIAEEDIPFIRLLDSAPQTPSPPTEPGPPISHHTWPNAPRPEKRLTPLSFSDDMLLDHIRTTDFSDEMTGLLSDAVSRKDDIDLAMSFRDFAAFEREGFVSSTFEVYDIAADATASKMSLDVEVPGLVNYGEAPYESPDGIVDAPLVWEALKDVNADGQSVGRITIVQEPTPLILAALHLSMSPHFDMTELLHHLLTDSTNRGRTHPFMHRAFERQMSSTQVSAQASVTSQGLIPAPEKSPLMPDVSFTHLRQRSFFFVFKYYTVVGDGLEPAFWQRYDKRPLDKRTADHIDIAECSSVLALSLEGEPTKKIRIRPRREKPRDGYLFDTFGPWHLLSIQSFPDDQHTVRTEDFVNKSFYNGPYAFLDLLVAEYRDAGKRNQILHDRITKLITPPTIFMFDRRLRDKLLFEDGHYTYIRRYFWAYNTLGVINTGIKAMIGAYHDTFTDDFWSGRHPLIWAHPDPASTGAEEYAERLAMLRKELDKVVAELGEVLKRNERTRKEIESLREQLFCGSSIKLSRQTIDQGDNIRILTMISMIFLPLTFVTSVFGITMFDIPPDDWRFAITMVLTCVPFMILIALFQTRTFHTLLGKLRSSLHHLLALSASPTSLATRLFRSPTATLSASTGTGGGGGGVHRWSTSDDDSPSSSSEMALPQTPTRTPRGRKGRLLAFDIGAGRKAAAAAGWWGRWWPSSR